MTKLSVNINKIAVVRNSRGGNVPDLLAAALAIERFGADGITVHPRPDARHIRYDDVRDLKRSISTELNVEGQSDRQLLPSCRPGAACAGNAGARRPRRPDLERGLGHGAQQRLSDTDVQPLPRAGASASRSSSTRTATWCAARPSAAPTAWSSLHGGLCPRVRRRPRACCGAVSACGRRGAPPRARTQCRTRSQYREPRIFPMPHPLVRRGVDRPCADKRRALLGIGEYGRHISQMSFGTIVVNR